MAVSAKKSRMHKDERLETAERILVLPSVSQYGISGLVIVKEGERFINRSALLGVNNTKLASGGGHRLA